MFTTPLSHLQVATKNFTDTVYGIQGLIDNPPASDTVVPRSTSYETLVLEYTPIFQGSVEHGGTPTYLIIATMIISDGLSQEKTHNLQVAT